MPLTVTVKSVEKDANGSVRVHFTDKTSLEWRSIADMRADLAAYGEVARQTVRMLACAMMLHRQSNLANPGVFAGRGIEVDLASATLMRVV